MDFLGIGSWEILLILVVALIVLGPHKIPEIARTLGKVVRALKKASYELSTAVTREIDEETTPLSKPSQSGRIPGSKTEPAPSNKAIAETNHSGDPPKKPEGHQQKND